MVPHCWLGTQIICKESYKIWMGWCNKEHWKELKSSVWKIQGIMLDQENGRNYDRFHIYGEKRQEMNV